ncbi:hypothetical protein JCM15765_44530 [Paradesulfitobacterium aromaticivorans]
MSLRTEIEQAMGLKFPEQGGEPVIRFEESMEVPRSAENLMRGFYRDPEKVQSAFNRLLAETGSLLDVLLPRRSRLREWTEELPERPHDAESFLRTSSEQLVTKEQRMLQAEKDLLQNLKENAIEDLFPVQLNAFGVCSVRESSVKIFLKSLSQLAEILELNPEKLRFTVRIHFLFLLLLVSGLDLDGKSFARSGDEPMLHALAGAYAYKYLGTQAPEYVHCYKQWFQAWGGSNPSALLLAEESAEKLRAAMIFWRRQDLSWEACWRIVGEFESLRPGAESQSLRPVSKFIRPEDF